MPYIKQSARMRLDRGGDPENVGELTYAMTKVVTKGGNERRELLKLADTYIARKGVRFDVLAEILGAFTATELEYYRRTDINEFFKDRMHCTQSARAEFYREVVAPYEDRKIAENGDVFYP